jgi:hypothetical protein
LYRWNHGVKYHLGVPKCLPTFLEIIFCENSLS